MGKSGQDVCEVRMMGRVQPRVAGDSAYPDSKDQWPFPQGRDVNDVRNDSGPQKSV